MVAGRGIIGEHENCGRRGADQPSPSGEVRSLACIRPIDNHKAPAPPQQLTGFRVCEVEQGGGPQDS